MSEPSARDRLQPSLLDRLTDFEPHARHEARERRVVSARALRESVQRDIGWLLNASGLADGAHAPGLPHVATSVRVTAIDDTKGAARSHVIRFEIEAQMWSQPYPERLFLRTELDLEAGEVRVADASTTRAGSSAGEQQA
jgi:type VI secretion system protein ImpF